MTERLLVFFELALDFGEGLADSFLCVVTLLLRCQHAAWRVTGERDVIEPARRILIYEQPQEERIRGVVLRMPIEARDKVLNKLSRAMAGRKVLEYKIVPHFSSYSPSLLTRISLSTT